MTEQNLADPNRIYHGLGEPDEHRGRPIVVEAGGGGPTERERAILLYRLVTGTDDECGPHSFFVGYEGTGPHQAARAILLDALGQTTGSVHIDLETAFVHDVLSHLPAEGEWHLHRRAILRWVLGWCVEMGIDPPEVMRPISATR
ncbi:hypothetical protein D5S17_23245 [Pseudonocardiaceae bacterium YIM PH 21723]|nr:hypothetical protein D5S17_23245 [Pseudonocardiaceae bacterium YIM PH 21723]